MHFSLVKINPPDASPSHGFDDAILPLYFALKRLGFDVEILFNRTNPQSRNIIFGSCIAPRRTGRNIPSDSIIFNLEQITEDSKWCNPDYMLHLRDFEVWDYSEDNVPALQAKKINALHVPLGYVPEMSRIKRPVKPETDLLFYGLVTDRRHTIINRLAHSGLRVLATQNAFGNLRDALLCRSGAVLNIHQFLPARLEVVRLGYLWANKIPVISERRDDTMVPEHLEKACLYAPYDMLAEAAQRFIGASGMLLTQGENGFTAFASRPMELSLERIFGRRIHPVATASSPYAAEVNAPAPPETQPTPLIEWLVQSDMAPAL